MVLTTVGTGIVTRECSRASASKSSHISMVPTLGKANSEMECFKGKAKSSSTLVKMDFWSESLTVYSKMALWIKASWSTQTQSDLLTQTTKRTTSTRMAKPVDTESGICQPAPTLNSTTTVEPILSSSWTKMETSRSLPTDNPGSHSITTSPTWIYTILQGMPISRACPWLRTLNLCSIEAPSELVPMSMTLAKLL